MRTPILALLPLLFTASLLPADSGGRIIPEQAAYDVLFYRLDLRIDPASRSIRGSVLARAAAVDTMSRFVLDLNANYAIDSIRWGDTGSTFLTYTSTGGRIWIDLPSQLSSGDTAEVRVFYHGVPKVSANPPWDDGFVWKTSWSGAPWAGVACETEGGDAWWPCKDHPSDEPDSVRLLFTVPDTLVCVSNGTLVDTVTHGDGTKTFEWFVSNPISNYAVTFYLGQYVRIPVSYTSVTGQPVPSEYWFLPESEAAAIAHIPLFLRDIRFFEEYFGPYPFRADKYGLCEAPYWGMEHQTIIAYGNKFNFNSYGFDYIHLHEVAHEWWGNLVTAEDWSDVWLHEGFACYAEALYAEYLNGAASYRSYMAGIRGFNNSRPVAPRDTMTANEGYNGPVYKKGAWVLHTLRYEMGDSAFFRLLHRWAYPDSLMEQVTDGRQNRLATTDELLAKAEEVSGKTLDWFFEVYLRQLGIPRLSTGVVGDTLYLKWYVENDIPFPLPVDVLLGPDTVRVEMPGGEGLVAVPSGVTPVVDPANWLLKTTGGTISASRAFIAFGSINVDSSKTDSVTINNTWATTLHLSSAWADLPDYAISPASADIPAGEGRTFAVTFNPQTAGSKLGHAYFVHNAPGSPVWVALTGAGTLQTSSYPVSKSWNIVSVPLEKADPRKTVLFPTATTPAYEYLGGAGYLAKDSLRPGAGYWMKFGSDQTVTLAGIPLAADTVDVAAGWNLIGSVGAPAPVGSITADPPEMTATGFFRYDAGYLRADTIEPAKGYWVKVDMDGTLILQGIPPSNPGMPLVIVPTAELPPPPPGEEASGRPRGLPAEYLLEQNFPNPFNPSTVIGYQLPEAGWVTLKVYDLVGREVATLVDRFEGPGYRSVEWDASGVPSGVYCYRIAAGRFADAKRLVVMK